MPLIKLNATQGLTGALPAVSGANLTNIDGGKVINHYSNVQTSAITINATTSTVITSPNITPVSTSSKFVITPTFCWSSTNPNGAIFMYRELSGYNDLSPTQSISGNFGTTGNVLDLDENIGGSSNTHGFITYSCTFVDSPNTTSQLNYTLRVSAGSGQTVYVNRVHGGSTYRGVSTLSILELSS